MSRCGFVRSIRETSLSKLKSFFFVMQYLCSQVCFSLEKKKKIAQDYAASVDGTGCSAEQLPSTGFCPSRVPIIRMIDLPGRTLCAEQVKAHQEDQGHHPFLALPL